MNLSRVEIIVLPIIFILLFVLFLGFSFAYDQNNRKGYPIRKEIGQPPFSFRTSPYYIMYDLPIDEEKDTENLRAILKFHDERDIPVWAHITVSNRHVLEYPLVFLSLLDRNTSTPRKSPINDCPVPIYYEKDSKSAICGCVDEYGNVYEYPEEGCFLHTTWHWDVDDDEKNYRRGTLLLVVPF